MTNPVTPQDYAALLESLRVTEEGPCPECYGNKCEFPGDGWTPCNYCGGTGKVAMGEMLLPKKYWGKIKEIRERHDAECRLLEGTDYQPSNADVDRADLLCFLEIIERRAEAKPSTLLEDVKACMRAGMDAERKGRKFPSGHVDLVKAAIAQEFRKLSEEGDTRPIAKINKPTKLEPIFGDSEAGE